MKKLEKGDIISGIRWNGDYPIYVIPYIHEGREMWCIQKWKYSPYEILSTKTLATDEDQGNK